MTSSKETELRAPNKIPQDRKGDCESGMRQMALECSVTIRYNQNAAHDANIRKFAMICKRIGGTTLLENLQWFAKLRRIGGTNLLGGAAWRALKATIAYNNIN